MRTSDELRRVEKLARRLRVERGDTQWTADGRADVEEALAALERAVGPVRQPGGKFVVAGHPRHVGPEAGHLSECLVVEHPELECTCDDDSPEWTSS